MQGGFHASRDAPRTVFVSCKLYMYTHVEFIINKMGFLAPYLISIKAPQGPKLNVTKDL